MGGIADVFDVREHPDLKGFDNIVIGNSIRYFKIHPLLRKYIEENKGWLTEFVGLPSPSSRLGEMYLLPYLYRKLSHEPYGRGHGPSAKDRK